MAKRLYRSEKNRILAGVCGGMGEYLNIDPVIVRLIWVALTFAGGAGLLLYIISLFIIPSKSELRRNERDYRDYNETENGEESNEDFSDEKKNEESDRNFVRNISYEDKNVVKILVASFLILVGIGLFFNAFLPFSIFRISWKIMFGGIFILLGGAMIIYNLKERKKWN